MFVLINNQIKESDDDRYEKILEQKIYKGETNNSVRKLI